MGEGHCQSKGEGGMIVAIVTVLSNDFIKIILKNRFCYVKFACGLGLGEWVEIGFLTRLLVWFSVALDFWETLS